MLTITDRIHALYDNVGNRQPGQPFTRYKSWEYCHSKFMEYHQKQINDSYVLNDNDYDLLALNLAFYLASWGMYRGSSFLLQRDYKTHLAAVRIIMDPSIRAYLWEYNPSLSNDLVGDAQYIFDLGNQIAETYKPILEKMLIIDDGEEEAEDFNRISHILITKILMGTFACVPAYDRFFVSGIKKENEARNLNGQNKLVQSYSTNSLKTVFQYASNNFNEFNGNHIGNHYPIMKNVDMYFWQLGYEIGFFDGRSQFQKLLAKYNRGEDLDNVASNANSRDKIILLFKTFVPDTEYLQFDIRNLAEWQRVLETRNN